MSLNTSNFGIQSTAGAIPVKNEKGELSMQKVKVHRYISGKRPDYAPKSSSEEDSDSDGFIEPQPRKPHRRLRSRTPSSSDDELKKKKDKIERDRPREKERNGDLSVVHAIDDPRLRRLRQQDRPTQENTEIRKERHRHIHEPEVIEEVKSDDDMDLDDDEPQKDDLKESSDEGNLSDDEIERRRAMLRQKLLCKREVEEMELLAKEEEKKSDEEEESSEYEEYTDSEEEAGPRMKPVFVRKRDRMTIIEKEKENQKQKLIEIESKKMGEERRRQTLKMIEEDIRKEQAAKIKQAGEEASLDDVNTDDENDEMEYDAWKLRELKRIKRDREERETLEKERAEIERLRNMTEEERRIELRNNPKLVTNKATKGKYKFLQKYYHRGAFYLDEEDEVFKRDFSQATLEDHFDKTILPKVMQVKNFGRSGRTKYTHLVDQDTTELDSPWSADTAQNLKFFTAQAAGMKQVFERQGRSQKKRATK